MRVVYQAEHLIDAHLVRGRLQAEGVEAHVQGEWLTGAFGELPLQGLLAVWVDARDEAAALALLARWREESDAAPEDVEDGPDDVAGSEFSA